jgi:DNA-binding NtrC family response regulator
MEPSVSRQRTILVVDDDDATRELLCRWLEELGLTGVAKDNGYSGLSRLALQKERGQIHGVLLDLQMRHFGGMAVLRELRQQHPALPVIVMVGTSKVDKVWEAMSMGARELLLKPFDHKVFRQKCSTVFLNRGNSD